MRAGIAFGSNLGDRLDMMRRARACVLASALLAPPFLASSLYLTSPVDCPPGSDDFVNAVIEAELVGAPIDLLRDLRRIEFELGRQRSEHHAPRSIDLDLLYAGDFRIDTPELRLPHPAIAERSFVLTPLYEIRGDLVIPGHKKSVTQLLENLPKGESVQPLDTNW
jgi:2-amino-4-hydroxy-6-hydroxymethyldihydropteridine diphosphokinase